MTVFISPTGIEPSTSSSTHTTITVTQPITGRYYDNSCRCLIYVTIDLSYLSCADELEPSSTSSPTINPRSIPTVKSTGRLSCTAIILYTGILYIYYSFTDP